MSKDDVQRVQGMYKNVTTQPTRLIEWTETPNKQRFDKPITAKIGW